MNSPLLIAHLCGQIEFCAACYTPRINVQGVTFVQSSSKLHAIRNSLGLTQEEMIRRLNCKRIPLYPASISEYEKGKREPPLLVLLQYARVAGVPMEALVDDDLDLPKRLPGRPKYESLVKSNRTTKRH